MNQALFQCRGAGDIILEGVEKKSPNSVKIIEKTIEIDFRRKS